MRTRATMLLLAALAAAAPIARAQQNTPAGDAPEPNPAPSNAIEIDAARRFDLTSSRAHQTYYRAVYLGNLLTTHGAPLKQASGLDLLPPALPASAAAPAAASASGDRRDWTLRYENREARLGGSLLEAEGIQPLKLGAISDLDLRGTAAIATDKLGTRAAVGLETPPFRLPGFAGREVANWLVLGLNGQRDPAPAGGGAARDSTRVTYRAFAGKGFGWRPSADVATSSARIEAEILELAPTYKAALEMREKINQAARSGIAPNASRTRVLLAIDEAESEFEEELEAQRKAAATNSAVKPTPRRKARAAARQDRARRAAGAAAAPAESASAPAPAAAPAADNADRVWHEAVRAAARDIADAQDRRPTFSVYAEASGWYTAKGPLAGERRQRNLLIATLDWWLVPTRDDLFLRLRYEDGYEWTAPALRRQQVSVSITVRL